MKDFKTALETQWITVHPNNPTVGFIFLVHEQLLRDFYSLKGRQDMKTLSLSRTFFLALGIMVAILVVLTTSVFGMSF